jgi:hypothetical protein
MKARFLFLLSLVSLPLSIFGQGQLNPMGTPSPTMKSLDQVEARIVIDSRQPGFTLPYTINSSGSYYLAANITAASSTPGIIVNANNVTIDLNGFALVGGGGGSVAGINVPNPQSCFCVRNGSISGWSGPGVNAPSAIGSLFEKLSISGNGGTAGIVAFNGSNIRGCIAFFQQGAGFSTTVGCTVADSTAYQNITVGFLLGDYNTIVNCTASRNDSNGIQTLTNCSILHCTAGNNTQSGIATSFGCTVADCTTGGNGVGVTVDKGSIVRGCTARTNTTNGIVSTNNCLLLANTCDSNAAGGSSTNGGIFTAGNGNTIDSNSCTSNNSGGGIISTGTHNIIIRNSCTGNGFNYNINGVSSGNTIGPVVDSSAGGVISSTANLFTNWIH